MEILKSFVGTWEGTCRTWFHPGTLGDESKIKGEFKPMLGGRLVRHTYAATLISTACCLFTSSGIWLESGLDSSGNATAMTGSLIASVAVTIPTLVFAQGFLVTRASVRPPP